MKTRKEINTRLKRQLEELHQAMLTFNSKRDFLLSTVLDLEKDFDEDTQAAENKLSDIRVSDWELECKIKELIKH